MNKDNAHLYLPLVKALAEGKTIQIEVGGVWSDATIVTFNYSPERYRIKPEPRVRWAFYRNDGIFQTTFGDEEAARAYREYVGSGTIVKFVEELED